MNDLTIAKMYIKKAQRAKKDKLDFDLTFAQFKRLVTRKRCAYSGLPFSEYDEKKGKWKKPWQALTLDRIDNKKGYIWGNVAPICKGINQIKAQWENPVIPIDEKMTIKIITKILLLRNS